MKNLFVILFLSVFVACSGSTPPSNGKLYIRTIFMSGSLSISFVYLGNDGTIVIDPKLGADPINPDAEAKLSTRVGKYSISNKNATVTWRDGSKNSYSVEYQKGEISGWDAGVMVKCDKYPANTRFEKSFKGGNVVSGGGTLVGSFRNYNFHSNGTFDLGTQGIISTTETGASSDKSFKGTYILGGNTLKLTFDDGKADTFVIAPFEDYYGKEGFILNGTHFKIAQ